MLARYTFQCILKYPIDFSKQLIKRPLQFFLNANQVMVKNFFLKKFLNQPSGWDTYLFVQMLNVVVYGAVLFFFGVGILEALRQDRSRLVLLVPVLYMLLFLVMFTPQIRYRLPVWTFVYVYAGFGMAKYFIPREP
ncbi:MAG: hypothetical protein HYS56_01805 [Candidatus Omnitrophica bacterium]|nr:hypothetical protein [Candidatus Omnitrophota bacterium]